MKSNSYNFYELLFLCKKIYIINKFYLKKLMFSFYTRLSIGFLV